MSEIKYGNHRKVLLHRDTTIVLCSVFEVPRRFHAHWLNILLKQQNSFRICCCSNQQFCWNNNVLVFQRNICWFNKMFCWSYKHERCFDLTNSLLFQQNCFFRRNMGENPCPTPFFLLAFFIVRSTSPKSKNVRFTFVLHAEVWMSKKKQEIKFKLFV